MKRDNVNKLQILDDYSNREILKLLEIGDYVECYNGNRGKILFINFPKFTIILDNSIQEVHLQDIQKYKFVKENWSSKEVEVLLHKAFEMGQNSKTGSIIIKYGHYDIQYDFESDKFIKWSKEVLGI